ncbi:MAG: asparagine synthase (glutamine-hydrolyzing) [Pyrinomonadaceae bacterium]
MCGIAGAFVTGGGAGVINTVEEMSSALAHRGPDDQGIAAHSVFDGSGIVVLALRRLAIIDLSPAGHQPMQDEGAGLTIAYNGETYNFRELREEIGDEFGPWHSHTDTEVVLRSYRKWGVEAFGRLRGMFSLAIWDRHKQTLILARDPFGIKPLYYFGGTAQTALSRQQALNSKPFIFASEVRALLASGVIPRDLSAEGVSSYLEYGSVAAPLTILEGVRSLLPGHFLRVGVQASAYQIEEVCYSGRISKDVEQLPGLNRHEALAILRQKLEESVRLHLTSDVPLGVFLSGGMDSSALVALMSRVTSEKPKTFSVVFDEQKFSEAPYSRLVAQTFRTEHHEIRLADDELFGLLPAALNAMDQPTMDGVNTFVVSKAVKQAGVTVALSGLGGDELFAGYPSFRRAFRLHEMRRIFLGLRRPASVVSRAFVGRSNQQKKFWELVTSDGSPLAAYSISRQLFGSDELAKLSQRSNFKDGLSDLSPRAEVNQRNPEYQGHAENNLNSQIDTVNAVSHLELQGYMANTLLRDTDSMSMAHSLEVRVPFVDIEVVRFVLSLPGQWKLNGGGCKPLLREAVQDLFPVDFLKRPKMGFTFPFESWMQLRLRDELSDVLGNSNTFNCLGLNPNSVNRVWENFLRAPQRVGWSRPWSLYVLAKWCHFNGVTLSAKA